MELSSVDVKEPETTRPPTVYCLIFSVFHVAVTYSVVHVFIFVILFVICIFHIYLSLSIQFNLL